MLLTVPRRFPRCLPIFLFVACICSTFLHPYIAMFVSSGACILVVSVQQNCGRLCLCCVDVFVVVRVALNAVFPGHSYVFYC